MLVDIQKGGSNKVIAGVVILYNPDGDVTENILGYYRQLDFLYIIENSSVKTESLIDFISANNSTTEYTFIGTNIGIAAAMNMAAKKACSSAYKYLLTMDQDSTVPGGMVSQLLEVYNKYPDAGIVSPLHSNKYGTHLFNQKGIHEVPGGVMTSGNILSLEAYKAAGPFNEDYFIDYVDVEYCLRLKKHNYKIISHNDIILEHNEANLSEKKLFNRKFYPPNHNPVRLYYKSRNLLLLRKQYKNSFPELISDEIHLFLRNILKIILFEKHKFPKLKMVLLGILDYFRGKKGKKF